MLYVSVIRKLSTMHYRVLIVLLHFVLYYIYYIDTYFTIHYLLYYTYYTLVTITIRYKTGGGCDAEETAIVQCVYCYTVPTVYTYTVYLSIYISILYSLIHIINIEIHSIPCILIKDYSFLYRNSRKRKKYYSLT